MSKSRVIYSSDTNPSKSISMESQALDQLTEASHEPLITATTVFPFTLFRDSVRVDKTKVDIVYTHFFLSQSIFTILIDDIKSVRLDTGPFFASLTFEVEGYEANPEPVRYLPKEDAIKVHDVITGLTAASHKEISLETLPDEKVLEQTSQIGNAKDTQKGV